MGFLVLEDVILLIWGTDPYLAFRPLELMGSSDITGLIFDNYTFTMIGFAFGTLLIGRWIDRFGAVPCLATAAAAMGMGYGAIVVSPSARAAP